LAECCLQNPFEVLACIVHYRLCCCLPGPSHVVPHASCLQVVLLVAVTVRRIGPNHLHTPRLQFWQQLQAVALPEPDISAFVVGLSHHSFTHVFAPHCLYDHWLPILAATGSRPTRGVIPSLHIYGICNATRRC